MKFKTNDERLTYLQGILENPYQMPLTYHRAVKQAFEWLKDPAGIFGLAEFTKVLAMVERCGYREREIDEQEEA